jgi:hypothetical protein
MRCEGRAVSLCCQAGVKTRYFVSSKPNTFPIF